jgi:hypothetical protein
MLQKEFKISYVQQLIIFVYSTRLDKEKNEWTTQEIKRTCKHKIAYISIIRTVMTQMQEHFILSIVKSCLM